MKQNERILVYLVTGFLAVILVVAVMFGRDGSPADAKAKVTSMQGLADILGEPKGDTNGTKAAPTADPAGKNASGLAAPEQIVGQQPLVAGKSDIVAVQLEQLLGQSRRDRTVRFVRARSGDSLDTLVRRWCGARDPFLDEAKSLNEDLVVLKLGQEVAVPWVDNDVVYAAWQARQPQKPTLEGSGPGVWEPTAANATGNPAADGAQPRPSFAQPGERAAVGGAATGAGAPAAVPANARPYTVKPGDSLWKVAERLYGRKQADRKITEIRQLNPGLGDTLKPGQTFFVPAAEEAAPAKPATPPTGA